MFYVAFIEFYWVLLGFMGFYWVLWGFTGFCEVFLGFPICFIISYVSLKTYLWNSNSFLPNNVYSQSYVG